jgi:hypothetical protein
VSFLDLHEEETKMKEEEMKKMVPIDHTIEGKMFNKKKAR